MTVLLQPDINSATRGVFPDEFAMAVAVEFPGLVESPGLVVGMLTAGQRRQHRGLVRVYRELTRQPAGSLGSASGIGLMLLLCAAYVFGCAFRSLLPRADVQRICLFDTWLSSVVVGRSVATVAEICFVGAVGDHPAPARHHDRSRNHPERRVGDRAVDRHRGMLFLACGADHPLSAQRHREFALGRGLLHHRDRSLPAAAGIRRSGARGPRRRDRRDRRLSGVSR